MTDEYPGVSRLIVEWTDPDEVVLNWPFNANGREVRSVTVDGVEYVDAEKLKMTNGELCAQVNELEKRIAELEEVIDGMLVELEQRERTGMGCAARHSTYFRMMLGVVDA